jgi:glycosyltransferase involved in cell wall biosynthesis
MMENRDGKMVKESKGKQQKPDITVFFPAYNEEENIPYLLKSATAMLKRCARNYEILVVVYEGSTDQTIPIVKKWEKRDSHIRLVIQPKGDKGIGAAKKIGFKVARYPYVFYADSDNQFRLHEFERFLPHIGKYDVIAGFRIRRQDPKTRIWISRLYNLMLRILMGAKERDLDCAFRLVSKNVVENITLNCRTGLATTELLVKARKKGFTIKEVGVNHYPRMFGKPVFELEIGLNLPKPKVVLDIVKEIGGLWKELYITRKY